MIKKMVLVKDGVAHPINVGGVVTPGSYVLSLSGKNSLVFHSEDGNEVTLSQGHSDSSDEDTFNILSFGRDNGISLGIFNLDGEDNLQPKSVLHVDKDNGISLNGHKVENVSEEYIDTQDAATLESAKGYADTQDETTLSDAKEYADGKVSKAGDEMTGNLNMNDHGISGAGVMTGVSAILPKNGNLLIKGQIELDSDYQQPKHFIKYVKTPVDVSDAANKGYVDTQDTATLTAAKEYVDTQKYIATDEAAAESYSISNPTLLVFYPEE